MGKKELPAESDQDKPDIEQVVSDFGDVRMRSGFEINEEETGVLEISIFGPVFEFLDETDEDETEHGEDES